MNSLKKVLFVSVLTFVSIFAFADTNPSNTWKIGDASSGTQKSFIFNIGGSNPSIRWNPSTMQIEMSNNNSTFSPINPMTTNGDMIYGGASGVATRAAAGSNTQVWTMGASVPGWQNSPVSPSGAIIEFAGTSCPTGFIAADGTSYSTGTYAALYAVIGSRWGSTGGGFFNVPDLRGQFLRGTTTGMGGVAISSIGSNIATVTAHGFNHSGVPVQITGTAPTGLSNSTTYYVIYVTANTISFATTLSNALAGTAISISGSTGGVVVQWQDPDAGSRVAEAISAATSGVGSCQLDQNASHTHTLYGATAGAGSYTGYFYDGNSGSGPGSGQSDPSGGNEARSKNAYILYCIKT